MVVVSYSGKEINAKLVYYGAGLSGKTTNLESIYEAVPETSRGKMVSMKTQSDRTLFFDLLPLDLGEIMGFKTRFLLYTVPGQVFYNATRKLVLKGADAIVFVADSEVGKMEENKESLANLHANLAEYGLRLEDIPWVIQYNKRDLPNVYSVDELNRELNPDGAVPSYEAIATQGPGVFETFRGISHLLMEKVTRELRRTPFSGRQAKVEPAPVDAAHVPATPKAPETPATVASGEAHETRAETRGDQPTVPFHYGREVGLPREIPVSGSEAEDASSGPPRPTIRWSAEETPAPVSPQAAGEPSTRALTLERAESGWSAPAGERRASAMNEMLVPITLHRGGSVEIVLRIVITDEGRAS